MRYAALLLPLLICSATAANWPQFRGPQAGGIDSSAAAPVRWDVDSGRNIRWHTTIPGLAHSSPILWDGRLYVTTAVSPGNANLKVGLYGDIQSANDQDSHQWRLIALDASTGKLLWNKLGYEGIPRVKRHPKSSHCSSTPSTDGHRIAAIFGSEGLFCFDMDGKLLWRKDLGPMASGYYVVPSAQWGFASSPVIHDGKVIVLCDVLADSFIAEFDLADGKELWRAARNDVPTWGTPTIAEFAGKTQVLVNGWHHTAAYDFASGDEMWRLKEGGDIPVPTPIVAGGLAYFTSGHGKYRPVRAVRLDARGDISPPEISQTNAAIAWVAPRKGNYMQTPILVGDCLYGCFDIGVLTCFDAKDGTIRYSERLGDGAEGFTSSPVSDGRNLYFASEVGKVYVVPANGQFAVSATNDLKETCMATPALSNGTLFYRTRDEVIAIGASATP